MTNSTISGNTSSNGGGIHNDSGTITFENTIIGGNSSACFGTLTSQGHNLVQNVAGCSIAGDLTGNITGQDPLLGPLQDNGGPTFTHALLAGSPAIDAGNDGAAPATDQRGTSRPQGLFSDIGAFEVIIATAVPVPGLTTWGMAALALGLGALVLVARRRRAAFPR